MKKYKISIRAQSFEFESFESAQQKVKELLDAGLWFLTLEDIKEEKKEIAPIDSEKGIEQRDQAREKMLKKAKKEKKKPGPKKGTKRVPKKVIYSDDSRLKSKAKSKSKKIGPRKFTPEVDKYLKENINKSNEDIAADLEIEFGVYTTPGSVANRKSVMGIKKKKLGESKEKKKGWSAYWNKKKKKDILKKYPDEMKGFIERHMETNSNQQLCDLINEKWDVDITKIKLNSYLTYNKIKRVNRIREPRRIKKVMGKKKIGKPKKYTDEVVQFLRDNINNFPNRDLCRELENRFNIKTKPQQLSQILSKNGIHRDLKQPVNQEITDFILKSKMKDPYELKDEVIMKFEKDISVNSVKDIMARRGKDLPGESVEEEVKRIEQNRDPLDEDIDELDLDG